MMIQSRDNYRYLFVCFTAVIFLTPVLNQVFRSNYMKLVEDMAYIFMLLLSVYIMVRRNMRLRLGAVTGCILLLMVLFSLIGAYYSGGMIILLQIREHKYLLVPFILLPFGNIKTFEGVWPFLKAFAYGCIPVAIVQRLIYQTDGDMVTGLLGYGGSGTLTLYLMIVFFSELALRLKADAAICGPYFLFLVPTLINETKIMILLFPVLLFSTLFITKKINLNLIMASIIICMLILAVWGYVYESTYGFGLEYILSPEYFESYMFATDWEVDAGRLAKILYAVEVIKDGHLLFGYGLGASYTGATSGAKGFILTKIYYPQMFGGTRPQIFVSLIEMGFIGVVAVVLVLLYITVKLYSLNENTLEKIIGLNTAIVVLVSLIYQSIFSTYPIMYMLMLYAFLAFKFSDRQCLCIGGRSL